MSERSWRFGVNGKTVLILLVATLIALAARSYVLAPLFRDQVGFIPFDLQPRLNREMIVIQLGLAPARHVFDYLRFALSDSVVSGITAAFTIMFWLWLFRVAPNRAFALLQNGGILLVPVVAAAIELVEHGAVYRLLTVAQRDDYVAAIDLLTTVHAAKAAAIVLRDVLTASFAVAALARLAWGRLRASG
jgi:hypothetical protein